MKKIVRIIESKTNKLIGEYPINLQSNNSNISNQDYFKEAWRCAVEDGLVDPSMESLYSYDL
jgi:hypothetical protein